MQRHRKVQARAIAVVRRVRWELAMIASALAFVLLHFARA
jgi:hypothetical protein